MKSWSTLFLALVATYGALVTAAEPAGDDQLYYVVERQFPSDRRWEARSAFAYDFSDPYAHLLGGQAAAFWSASPILSLGVEGTVYAASMRGSALKLQEKLKGAHQLRVLTPDYGMMGVVRVAPVSGLVNFFSSSVLQAEMGLSFRGGATSYPTLGWGASFGTALDVALRAESGLGVAAALVFDWDRVGGGWQQRTGVRVGPTYRF